MNHCIEIGSSISHHENHHPTSGCEVGYLSVRRAIEQIDENESDRRITSDISNLACTVLMRDTRMVHADNAMGKRLLVDRLLEIF
jgi:hypothetical protein